MFLKQSHIELLYMIMESGGEDTVGHSKVLQHSANIFPTSVQKNTYVL